MYADQKPQLTRLQAVAPFVIAGFCGALLAWFWFARPFGDTDFWLIGILGTILVFDLPVCILILIGRPPAMTLAPLFSSAQERAYRRALRERPPLSDDEFCDRFYADTGYPRDIPIRLRRIYATALGMKNAWPEDKAEDFCEELDFTDLIAEVEDEFGLKFTEEEVRQMDGSFNTIVEFVAGKLPRCE